MHKVTAMKISIDTKEDSREELKNVIRMLQNLVGDSQEIFTNQQVAQESSSPMANIFGDASQPSSSPEAPQAAAEPTQSVQKEATDQSTEDLFAELFSEEEIKKMEAAPAKEEEEKELPKSKSKKYDIEFY